MSSLFGGSPSFRIYGRLTKDPVAFQTKGGKPYIDFAVASNDRIKQGEDYVDKVTYIDIRAWNSMGTNILKRVKKGHRILIEGRIDQETWKNDDGENRSRLRFVAEDVILVDTVETAKETPVEEPVPA